MTIRKNIKFIITAIASFIFGFIFCGFWLELPQSLFTKENNINYPEDLSACMSKFKELAKEYNYLETKNNELKLELIKLKQNNSN